MTAADYATGQMMVLVTYADGLLGGNWRSAEAKALVIRLAEEAIPGYPLSSEDENLFTPIGKVLLRRYSIRPVSILPSWFGEFTSIMRCGQTTSEIKTKQRKAVVTEKKKLDIPNHRSERTDWDVKNYNRT